MRAVKTVNAIIISKGVEGLKYFGIFSKIIYTLFFVLTAILLILALTNINKTSLEIPVLKCLAIFYLLVLLITALTVIVNLIIIIKELIKVLKVKRVLIRVFIGVVIGIIFKILLSLIKHRELFSLDFIYLIIVTPVFSLYSLFLKNEK